MAATRRQFLHACAAGVIAHAAVPRAFTETVAGTVTDTHGAGLARVRVSNGHDVVLTNARGAFELPPPRALSFVFASAPSGYVAERASYVDIGIAPSPVTFVFRPEPKRATARLRIAHLSDSHTAVAHYPHYATAEMFAADMRRAVSEASPDLVVVTGDLTDIGRHEDLDAHRRLTMEAVGELPIVSLFAGHDALDEWSAAEIAGSAYRAIFGPQWFSFDWGPWRLLVFPELNTPDAAKRNQVLLEGWLERELALLDRGQRVVIITHDPPRWHSDAVRDMWGPRLDRLPQGARPLLIVHGQYHSTRIVSHQGTTVVGSTSSTMGGIDTSPRGYGVIDLSEAGIQSIDLRPFAAPSSTWRPARGASSIAPEIPGHRLAWRHTVGACLHRATPCPAGPGWILALDDRPDPRDVGLVAIDDTSGSEVWRWRSESTIKAGCVATASPTGGVVYAVSVAGKLTALDAANGSALWEVDLPNAPDRWIYTRPLVDGDRVLVAQYSGSSAYHRETGAPVWREGPQAEDGWSPVYQTPSLSDGLAFLLTTKSLGHYAVSARRTANGEVVWMRRLDVGTDGATPRLYQLAFCSPMVTAAGLVVSGLGHRMLMLDPASGETIWDVPALLHEGPRSGVDSGRRYYAAYEHAIGCGVHDDLLVIATANGCAYGLDLHTGRRRWQFVTDRPPLVDAVPYIRARGAMLTAPSFAGDRAFLGGADGWLYVLDTRTGQAIAEVPFGTPITTAPMATKRGVLVTTFDGRVQWYAADRLD